MAEAYTLADFIRGFFRNTKILSDHPRLGPVAGSPRWLSAQLKSGKKLDDFRIELSDHARRRALG